MTQSNESSSKLDRVETILEAMVQRQDGLLHQQEIETLRRQELRDDMRRLEQMQEQTQVQLDSLAAQVTAHQAQATADYATEAQARNEFRQEMRGLQRECRNILRELSDMRRQQGNGQSQP